MITRRTLARLAHELKELALIENLAEYKSAKDHYLERAVPLVMQSKRIAFLADAMKSSLAVGLFIPPKGEASSEEIARVTEEAKQGIRGRIQELSHMLMKTGRIEIPLAVLALMCLAGGITALAYFSLVFVIARQSLEWPSTAGSLLKSRVSSHSAITWMGRLGTWREMPTHGLAVEYEYRVRGTLYNGQRFSFEPKTEDREYWERKAEKYRSGMQVDVRYDPQNPVDSVLETGPYEKNHVFIILGMAFAGFGAFFMARVIKFRFF